jgi:hypothetical protein
MKRFETLIGALVLASPALAAVAFASWLDLGPRAPLDVACGVSDLTGIGSLVLFALPSVVVAVWARRSGWRLGPTVVLVATTLLFTAVSFFFAFLIWFGKHMCGE